MQRLQEVRYIFCELVPSWRQRWRKWLHFRSAWRRNMLQPQMRRKLSNQRVLVCW